jgi:hypothetical protein
METIEAYSIAHAAALKAGHAHLAKLLDEYIEELKA